MSDYFLSPENRGYKELAEGARTRTFWGAQMLFSLVEVEAGALVPLHTHPHEQGASLSRASWKWASAVRYAS